MIMTCSFCRAQIYYTPRSEILKDSHYKIYTKVQSIGACLLDLKQLVVDRLLDVAVQPTHSWYSN